jgi:CheY-like chemotaxis protein
MENSLRGKRALLADDEPVVRDALRMLLECLDLEVTETADGLQALECYQQGTYDFVVTDYNMPIMRGDALAEAIRAINPSQRIIMVSGFAEHILRDGKLPPTINALVHKPCRLDQLAEALRDSAAAA